MVLAICFVAFILIGITVSIGNVAKELSKIRKILEEKEKLAHSVLKDTKSLDSDASQLVDEHFWDLVK